MTHEYDIPPFNDQLSSKLATLRGKINNEVSDSANKKHRRGNNASQLPSLSSYKEDGVDHINIFDNDQLLSKAFRVDSDMPFEYGELGRFNTIKGFWLYIATKEKDKRLRYYTGNKLKNLSRHLTKVRTADFKSEVLNAVYTRLTQYPEVFDLIKNNDLPFDCYYYTRSNIKTRPAYASWYLKGIEIIVNSVKNDKELDFSSLNSSPNKKFKGGDGPVNKNTRTGILQEFFTSKLLDFKVWLCNPTSRLRLICYKRTADITKDAFFKLLDKSKELEENKEASALIETFVKDFFFNNRIEKLRFKNVNRNGITYISLYEKLLSQLADILSEEVYEDCKDVFAAIGKALMVIDHSCRKTKGLSEAISEFRVNDGSNNIVNSYKNFLEHLSSLEYISKEYIEELNFEYNLTNGFLKVFLADNKLKCVSNMYTQLKALFKDHGVSDIASISHIVEESKTKSLDVLTSEVLEGFDFDSMKRYEADIVTIKVKNYILVCYTFNNLMDIISKGNNDIIIKEIEPTGNEISDFLDSFRRDLYDALEVSK